MELHVIFRMPKFPVTIVRGDALFCAESPESLLEIIATEIQDVEDQEITIFDATGEEFRYHDESKSIMPTLFRKQWTKKRIIELYNRSANAKMSGSHYSEKSLSAKKYERVINDICQLIRENPT